MKGTKKCHAVPVTSNPILLSYPVTKFPRVGMLKIQELIAKAEITEIDS